jgi:iron complex outermembrane receptor protein
VIVILLLAMGAAASSAAIASSAVIADSAAAVHAIADSVLLLPEVRVDRDRPVSEARRRSPTGFIAELRPGSSGRAFESLADVLEEAAGVRVVQYGGLGAFSTVSLRGANPNQVTVYLDGMPLTSAARGTVNLADLPLTAIERVEVFPGPSGLSASSPGGAVRLVTLPAASLGSARVARGSWDTWEGRGAASFARGPLTGGLHAGYQGASGDFPYFDDNATPFNAADDSTSRRLNNRFDATTVLGGLTFRPAPQLRLDLRAHAFHKAQGLPGLGATPARHPRLAYARVATQLEAAWAGTRKSPAASLRFGDLRERMRFRDAAAELGLGRHDTDDAIRCQEVSLELESPPLPGGLLVEGSGGGRIERMDARDAADGFPDPPDSRREAVRAGLGLRFRPLGDRVTLRAARHWDRLEDRLRGLGTIGTAIATDVARELDAPSLGAAVRGPLGLEARANWGRARRAPDFFELFGNQGTLLGNTALRPEDVESWDAGLAWSVPWPHAAPSGSGVARLDLEWAHFESFAHDLILYVRTSPSSARAQNITRSRVRGDELSVRLDGPHGWSARTGLTWEDAIDLGDVVFWHGLRLPQRPVREAFARVGWEGHGLGLSAQLHHIGDNYLDRSNRVRVASRTLVGASLSVTPFLHGLRLVVEGKNLGDRRVSDVAGFPLPGRSVFVACEARLDGPGSP